VTGFARQRGRTPTIDFAAFNEEDWPRRRWKPLLNGELDGKQRLPRKLMDVQ
jgi:hypothetical protein